MYRGLQYVGRGNGVSVQLYRSYTTVDLSWDRPYMFKPTDDTSVAAINWYVEYYKPLGVRIVEDSTLDSDELIKDGVKESSDVDSVLEPYKELADKSEESSDTKESASVSSAEIPKSKLDKVNNLLGDTKISELSENDLVETLDLNFDDEEIDELLNELNISKGRLTKRSKLIDLVVGKLIRGE